TVARTLPDTLRVEIRERAPLALAELDRLYLMDGDGSLIDVYGPRTAGFDLPIVRGLAGITGDARRARAQRAGALLQELGGLARGAARPARLSRQPPAGSVGVGGRAAAGATRPIGRRGRGRRAPRRRNRPRPCGGRAPTARRTPASRRRWRAA